MLIDDHKTVNRPSFGAPDTSKHCSVTVRSLVLELPQEMMLQLWSGTPRADNTTMSVDPDGCLRPPKVTVALTRRDSARRDRTARRAGREQRVVRGARRGRVERRNVPVTMPDPTAREPHDAYLVLGHRAIRLVAPGLKPTQVQVTALRTTTGRERTDRRRQERSVGRVSDSREIKVVDSGTPPFRTRCVPSPS